MFKSGDGDALEVRKCDAKVSVVPLHLPQISEVLLHYFRNNCSLSHQSLSSYGVIYFICGTWLSLGTFGFLSELLSAFLCCCDCYSFPSIEYFFTFLSPGITFNAEHVNGKKAHGKMLNFH